VAVADAGPDLSEIRRALAARSGPIMAPIVAHDPSVRFAQERHICVDTTAAGGNASLMTAAEA